MNHYQGDGRAAGQHERDVSHSCGLWHVRVYSGLRMLAWGIGETEDQAHWAADDQLRERGGS